MGTARLYVGNLSYGTTKEALEKVFSAHGEVVRSTSSPTVRPGGPRVSRSLRCPLTKRARRRRQPSTEPIWTVAPSMSTMLGSKNSASPVASAAAVAVVGMAAAAMGPAAAGAAAVAGKVARAGRSELVCRPGRDPANVRSKKAPASPASFV